MGWDGPTITDSGGFQVLSLGVGFKKILAMDASTVRSDDVDRHQFRHLQPKPTRQVAADHLSDERLRALASHLLVGGEDEPERPAARTDPGGCGAEKAIPATPAATCTTIAAMSLKQRASALRPIFPGAVSLSK